jgi:TRAP-type mannitol/chloroaromatic compound transport system permease small subunit
MNALLKYCDAVDKVNRFFGGILGYIALFIMCTGSYEVLSRYLFNRPTIWVWDYNALLMLSIAALGGGYCLLERGHVNVEIVYDRLQGRAKAILDVITSAFSFLFLGLLLWHGIPLAWIAILNKESNQALSQPPIYIFKTVLVIGTFLFLLQLIANILRRLSVAITPKEISK